MPASFARRVTVHVERTNALLGEIRKAAGYLRGRHGYSLWQLELVTKLHKNSLLRLTKDETWIPKPATLHALARLVEHAQEVRRGVVFEFESRRPAGRPIGSKNKRPRKVNAESKKPVRALAPAEGE